MSWRSLVISTPGRLSLAQGQLHIELKEQEAVTLPLEDIAAIVLETPRISLTSALLAALADADIALLTCDGAHHPNGVLLPFLPHSRQVAVLRRQLALSEPKKKRLWQRIVQAKLRNQADCLEAAQAATGTYLRNLATRVRSGDSSFCESQGSQYYFPALFGKGFTRSSNIWQNAALNYGYSILRAAIARSVVCRGFIPALGLHHRSELNAFNLVDDLIEPFRPLVDYQVKKAGIEQAENKQATLTPADKQMLVGLLYQEVQLPIGVLSVLAAIEQVCANLGQAMHAGSTVQLDLPDLGPAWQSRVGHE